MLVFDPHTNFDEYTVKIKSKKEEKMPENKSFGFMRMEEDIKPKQAKKENTERKDFLSKLSQKVITGIVMLILSGALIFAGSEFMNLRKQVSVITQNRTEIEASVNPRIDSLERQAETSREILTDIRINNAEISAKLDMILSALEEE